jgi:hypothetical protein
VRKLKPFVWIVTLVFILSYLVVIHASHAITEATSLILVERPALPALQASSKTSETPRLALGVLKAAMLHCLLR